jgi:hypothetical protein
MAPADSSKNRQAIAASLQLMQEPIISHGGYFYLKVALALITFSISIYVIHTPLGQPNGGTWAGYTLGTLAGLLCLWLAWFGIRKRRYGVGNFKLQEWVSAHIYLGLSLIVVATLHAGFQVGWNVHTLAYGLLLIVIVSGGVGLYLYIRLPIRMSHNRGGITFDELMALVSDLDVSCTNLAVSLGDEVNTLNRDATENTQIGGGIFMQLSGFDPDCPTAHALERIGELAKNFRGDDTETGRQLVHFLARKNEMLAIARRDVQFRAWLNVWLLIHVPATVGLLVALAIHVFTVFFYW